MLRVVVGLAAFVLLDIVLLGIAARSQTSDTSSAGSVAVGTVPTQLGSSEAPTLGAPPAPLAPQPAPAALAIPAINVSTTLVDLHVHDGELGVPADYSTAGWWTEGVVPGQIGPAVMVGHVDSKEGAAVFFRIRDLKPGDLISVTRVDGSTITFRVDSVQQVAKDLFPTAQIYGQTSAPTLRLITCGGAFNRRERHYEDNVIAFATIVPPTPAAPTPAPADPAVPA